MRASVSFGYQHRKLKNSLTDTNWIALPAVGGNGALQILSDPDASVPQRFYRLRQW